MKLSWFGRLTGIALLLTATVSFVFSWTSNGFKTVFEEFANLEGGKMATKLISNAVSEVTETVDEEAVILGNDTDTITYNVALLRRTLVKINESLLYQLDLLRRGKYPGTQPIESLELKDGMGLYQIPISRIFDNPILGRLGPKIPLKFSLIGDVATNTVTEVKPFGLNNAMIEVKLKIDFKTAVAIPLASQIILTTSLIPLSLKVIEGDVPHLYTSPTKIEGVNGIYGSLEAI